MSRAESRLSDETTEPEWVINKPVLNNTTTTSGSSSSGGGSSSSSSHNYNHNHNHNHNYNNHNNNHSNSRRIKAILTHFWLGEGKEEERGYDIELNNGVIESLVRSEVIESYPDELWKINEYDNLHPIEKDDYKTERRHVVESIIDREYVASQWMYQIKWKGYAEPTWEPESNLDHCPDLKQEYDHRYPKEDISPASSNEPVIEESPKKRSKVKINTNIQTNSNNNNNNNNNSINKNANNLKKKKNKKVEISNRTSSKRTSDTESSSENSPILNLKINKKKLQRSMTYDNDNDNEDGGDNDNNNNNSNNSDSNMETKIEYHNVHSKHEKINKFDHKIETGKQKQSHQLHQPQRTQQLQPQPPQPPQQQPRLDKIQDQNTTIVHNAFPNVSKIPSLPKNSLLNTMQTSEKPIKLKHTQIRDISSTLQPRQRNKTIEITAKTKDILSVHKTKPKKNGVIQGMFKQHQHLRKVMLDPIATNNTHTHRNNRLSEFSQEPIPPNHNLQNHNLQNHNVSNHNASNHNIPNHNVSDHDIQNHNIQKYNIQQNPSLNNYNVQNHNKDNLKLLPKIERIRCFNKRWYLIPAGIASPPVDPRRRIIDGSNKKFSNLYLPPTLDRHSSSSKNEKFHKTILDSNHKHNKEFTKVHERYSDYGKYSSTKYNSKDISSYERSKYRSKTSRSKERRRHHSRSRSSNRSRSRSRHRHHHEK